MPQLRATIRSPVQAVGAVGLNWVELLHYDAGDGKIIPKDKWVTIPIYLNDVDPVPVSIAKALVPGSFVRILPALPKGAILVRDVKRN